MLFRENFNKYATKIKSALKSFLILIIASFAVMLGNIQNAEMASIDRTTQINRIQEVTQIYPAYELRIKSGNLSADTSFQAYLKATTYGSIYSDLNIEVKRLPDKNIETKATSKIDSKLILYDTLKIPGVDWYDGCGKPLPKILPEGQ